MHLLDGPGGSAVEQLVQVTGPLAVDGLLHLFVEGHIVNRALNAAEDTHGLGEFRMPHASQQ